MNVFDNIYQRAAQRKGSEAALVAKLSKPLSPESLRALSDDQWLEEFTRKVFQSGFYWSVVDNKWEGFREVFWQFSVDKLLMMSPEMYEQRSQDERIIRNAKKVKSIADNCHMIFEVQQQYGRFSEFVASWPEDNIVGLWLYLKKHGARLGGNTGPYALRVLGKDTFLLSKDVETVLRAEAIIDGGLQSQKSLLAAQQFFNEMRQYSGFSLQELSQIVAMSVGENVR
ncbi:DNA-3-methyladenine glycosylase I [Pseudoalteromonas sp. McH1-7]|uniref:DNA-3-methyladenine glycosylase I n=1 Tax=unclassified Pseudoalteromonas TaxID=194690 RepID=UPI000F64E55C|nr:MULTISPECIES: DNA-3-methyladenine glycosylase I [unclassified Pseudoalteromonas]NUZ11422.1 DNA-3-methyladenine glycosylase I [Pseudoalteromonas sp. McH1-7]RRS09717.1 3-methyladenine DNA glycosylase [Pseudoalteromonas sp. J010]